jgi:hypothetical protein
MMFISTCFFASHLSLAMSLHIFVVCIVFMAISLRFGEGLLSLSYCELWSASRLVLLAFEVLLVVLAHKSSSLAWVLCCFVWVWCFIAQVLWVHLCDFSVAAMFMFMVISVAFMFFLHYNYSYIVNVFALQLFLHRESSIAWILSLFFVIFIGGSHVCVFCVVCKCLVLWLIMRIFTRSARIRTFVFYFMFLFVLISIFFFLSFFAKFGMLYVHCVHMFCVVTTMSRFL